MEISSNDEPHILMLASNMLMVLSRSVPSSQSCAVDFEYKEAIAGLSHDMKTPLTILGQSLEMLSDDTISLSGGERAEYTAAASHKCLELQRLIDNLFESAVTEIRRRCRRLQWTAISVLLEKMGERHIVYLKRLEAPLVIDCAADFEVHVDAGRIGRVFDNIIYNAARHTGAGGRITVSAILSGKRGIISFSDTGPGIAPGQLAHVFKRFYTAAPEHGERGSGLGLYIVKTYVREMDGHVTARNAPGGGACIDVSLRARRCGQDGVSKKLCS